MSDVSKSRQQETVLTDKQVEVLDLLIEHRSTKQIAQILRISPSAVDKRLYGAADRLGENDRRQLARKYAKLKDDCEKHTGGFSHLEFPQALPHSLDRDAEAPGRFTFNDATTFESFAPWTQDRRLPFLEKIDSRAGRLGRLAIIVATAALIAMLLLASFAIARTLAGLI